MRITRTLLLSLAALGLVASAAPGQRHARKPRVPPVAAAFDADRLVFQQQVKGRGETVEQAERDALKRAQVALGQFLEARQPPLRWVPSPEYIRKHLVTGPPARLEGEDQVIKSRDREFTVKCWSWPVAVTARQLAEMTEADRAERLRQQRAERAARSAERLLLLGKLLAGLVVALVAVVGYLKLDEWTGGYYTRRLQVGLAGLVAASVVGLWLWS